ncbi:Ankyrin repeat family protein [Euphorbia peplus]|nr:Ankyrin repeat family protein [Euphorbia peplus]
MKISPSIIIPKSTGRSWFSYFQYDETRDNPSDARNILLIIVALIAAATFQAGVNPPGGVWQDSGNGHIAGRAIYASQPHAYYIFLIANTLAFSTSMLVLVSLTYKFPFHLEIWIASVSMLVTYGSAIFAVTPRESVHFSHVPSRRKSSWRRMARVRQRTHRGPRHLRLESGSLLRFCDR